MPRPGGRALGATAWPPGASQAVVFPEGTRDDGLPIVLSDQSRLSAVASSASACDTPDRALDDLTRLAASTAGGDTAGIAFVTESVTYWRSSWPHRSNRRRLRGIPARDTLCYIPVGTGTPFVVEDTANDPRTAGHPVTVTRRIGAWAGFPIVAATGHTIGVLCVATARARSWAPEELDALSIMARAVGNEVSLRSSLARTEDALAGTRELARSLQDSLLPPVLPPIAGLDTAARYLPASGGATVVGDFYDLFRARGSRWTAVLGDVCGHGSEAAKVTVLARFTLRADARDHFSPAAVLGRLNAAMLSQHSPRYLTAVQVTFRVTRAGLAGTLCLAGHPPALVRRASGRVQSVGDHGTLLGVFEDVRLRDVHFRLGPGDLLLLYSDGACEARPDPGRSHRPRPMFDRDALVRTLAGSRELDASATVEHLTLALDRSQGGWASDDTALLALRVPAGG